MKPYLDILCTGNATAALTGQEYFPDPLLKEAERAWRAAVRRKSWMSQMHHEVSQALWNLRIAHQNDCVTADGLHSTSIIIDNSNVSSLAFSVADVYICSHHWLHVHAAFLAHKVFWT